MSNKFQVSVLAGDADRNVAVLRIASATSNSITQFYPTRIQVSGVSLGDLNQKLSDKLRLHRIVDTQVAVSLQFENDKTITFNSVENLSKFDHKTDARTKAITLKWSFVFDSEGNGEDHLHSVYVRVSERPSPGLFLQKMLNGHIDEIDGPEGDLFSPVVCKIDFFDSRFSTEVLSVVTEWVGSLPKAESTFGFVRWLANNDDKITSFVSGTLPAAIVLGYVGFWLGLIPPEVAGSVRIAAAWILGGGIVFLCSRYLATTLNTAFARHIRRITNIPVFQVTSGDVNRMTAYLSKSHNSMFRLAGTGVAYGAFKALGLYFATYLIRHLAT